MDEPPDLTLIDALTPILFTEEELARFPAVCSNFKSATFGRWKVELTIPHELKDRVWPLSNEQGLEVLVVIYKRRPVGIPELRQVAAPLEHNTYVGANPTLAAHADLEAIKMWTNVDGIVVDGQGDPV